MARRVLIAGENPFVNSIATLCIAHGYKVDQYLLDELDDQDSLDEMVQNATRCDIFIETVNESLANKLWLVEGVEANLRERVPLLSNCLCSSATEVASWCRFPQRVIGISLLPPITAPGLIEFAPAMQADFQSAAAAREFLQRLGFELVRVPDTPALVRARLLLCLINAAVFALEGQVASLEAIETGAELGLGTPQGLLTWADTIGLDVVLGALTGIHAFYQEERYRPAPLLRQKVRAGHLGKKTGRGFFTDPLFDPSAEG